MFDEEKYAKMFENMSKISEQLKNLQLPQIDWNNVVKRQSKINRIGRQLSQLNELCSNNLVALSISEKFRDYIKIVKESEGLTEKEFEEKFSAELEQSIKLGQHGWVPSEHGNPWNFSEWAEWIEKCPEKILEFFEEDDHNVLNRIIETLSGIYVELPYKTYYEKGLYYFKMEDYMTAAMYWTILMEIRITNLVDFPKQGQSSKRLTYRDKYSEYGFSLQRQKEFQEKNGFQAKRFYFLNFYPALQEYVHRLFAFGKLPFDINDTSKKEPDYLDRTWLMHGRCCREVTRMDCVQLINALDVCEFMFNKPEERKEFELICV